METNHKRARITGLLFIIPLLAYGGGDALITQGISPTTGALLWFINSVTVVAIGIFLFPVLKQKSQTVAMAYVCTRLVECILLLVGTAGILLLSVTTIKNESMAHLLIKNNYCCFQLAMMALGLGSLFFCVLLYRHRLVPAFLSLWGLLGYALLMAGALLEIFGFPYGIYLSVPGGLFEIFLGIWLMVKGFKKENLI